MSWRGYNNHKAPQTAADSTPMSHGGARTGRTAPDSTLWAEDLDLSGDIGQLELLH